MYFAEEMLKQAGRSLAGLRVSVSGSGNVAQYAVEKAMVLGAKVVTISDSSGTVVDEEGFTCEKLAELMDVKNRLRGRISEYAKRVNAAFLAGSRPWHVPVDVALPCATQNELDEADAAVLIKNGAICVAEGANMPCTAEAVKRFEHHGVLFAPGKASNAGGVATSGPRNEPECDATLILRKKWMPDCSRSCAIHQSALPMEAQDGPISYVDGANVAGLQKPQTR